MTKPRPWPAGRPRWPAALDALLRPYVRPIRQNAPDGAAVVHLTMRAFLDPDVHGDPV